MKYTLNILRMGMSLALILALFSMNIQAQTVTNTYNSGGNSYEFESTYKPKDLHFYLFDDGYHSFEQNPVHQYANGPNLPADPVYYTTPPYGTDNPDDIFAGAPPTIGTNQALTNDPTDMDNKVQLKKSWNLRQDEQNFYILMFENIESSSPISGCIEFHFNEKDLKIIESEILDDYNSWVDPPDLEDSNYSAHGYTHKYVWQFEDLEQDEQRFIYLEPTCNKGLDEMIKTCAVMNVSSAGECAGVPYPAKESGSGGNQDAVYVDNSMVSAYPHDPNCILATCDPGPNGTGQGGHNSNDRKITYRIYFQNEGEGPATNVAIFGQANHLIQDIDIVDASDFCTLTPIFSNPNSPGFVQDFKVKFPNINLPGLLQSNTQNLETIGWIDVRICYLHNLSSCVNLKGDIQFDAQQIFTVENEICSGTPSVCDYFGPVLDCNAIVPFQSYNPGNSTGNFQIPVEELVVYPNPSRDWINVELPNSFLDQDLDLEILDLTGASIQRQRLLDADKNIQVQISDLTPGIYLVQIANDKKRLNKTIVKI